MSTEKKNQLDDWSDDELSEDDLDNLAGGTGDVVITSSNFSFTDDQETNSDCLFTSPIGADNIPTGMAANMTLAFP